MNIFWILIGLSSLMKVEVAEAPSTTNIRVIPSTTKSPNTATMQTTTQVRTSLLTVSQSSQTRVTNSHLPKATVSTLAPSQTTNGHTSVNKPSPMSPLLSSVFVSKPALISITTKALRSSSVQIITSTNPSVQSTISSKQSASTPRTPRISTDQSQPTIPTTGSHSHTAFITSGTYITAKIANKTSDISNKSSVCQTNDDAEDTNCIGAIAAGIVCVIAALVVTALNITYFMVHRRRTRQTSEESLQEVKVYDFPEYIIIAKACIGHRKFDPEVLRTIDIMRDPLFDGVITLDDRKTPELSKTVRIQSFGELTVANGETWCQVP